METQERNQRLSNWMECVKALKDLKEREKELFERLVKGGEFKNDVFELKIKKKLNTTIDQTKAWAIINDDVRNPEKNFGVNPFRLKVEIDKKKMDVVRDIDPRYYELVIVPILTVKDAKPTLTVKKVGNENF